MEFVELADARIVRPASEVVERLRNETHAQVLQVLSPGKYTDSERVNAALQRAFEFYSGRLDNILSNLASRDFIQFLLHQYDETVRIGHGDALSTSEKEFWRTKGQQFRRALKYLCEKTALVSTRADSDLSQKKSLKLFNQALACAEEMVNLYHLSESTYSLFPDDIELELTKSHFDCMLRSARALCLPEFVRIVEVDRNNRRRFIAGLTFDTNPVSQCAVLDSCFDKAFGISFGHFLDFLRHAIDDPLPHPKGFPIPFINLEGFVKAGAVSGINAELVRKILAGFTLHKAAMAREGRVMWNPKQEFRALRRAFFEFPHPDGTHLVWSRGMAKESYVWLLSGVCFQHLPEEWVNDDTMAGLAAASNACSKWFETCATENLKEVGFQGQAFKNSIRIGPDSIEIPSLVGQLDFLGYSAAEDILLLAEFKIVEEGTEPRFYRDAISQFVRNKGNYAEKFRRKIAWVEANKAKIAELLKTSSRLPRLATVMISLYPSFASFFVEDFRLVSITHFRLDYERAGKWPYALK